MEMKPEEKPAICRACLTRNDIVMVHIDQEFVENYNIVTSLDIHLEDKLPQDVCQKCWDTVHNFILFRKKCLSSELALFETLTVKNEKDEFKIDVKDEVLINNELNDNDDGSQIKEEMKLEDWQNEDECKIILKPKRKQRKPQRLRVKSKKVRNIKNFKGNDDLLEDGKSITPCGVCPLNCTDESTFQIHLETHRNDSSCSICGEPCLDWQQLFSHRLHHLPKERKKCHKCNKRFVRDINMEYHLRIEHSTEPGMECKLCMRVYPTVLRLRKHILGQHSGKEYICDMCSKICKTKRILLDHIKSHDKKNIKKYACQSCDFSTISKTSMSNHTIRRHSKTKMYCKFCTRYFAKEKSLTSHKCLRSIICATCGKQFTGQKSHERHLKVHSDIRPYKCDRCPATYKYKANFNIHMNRHDGERTFCCDYCPAKFYTSGVLTKHRRTHTGEKPFVCKVCNRGFTGGHNLKVHMKVHGEILVVKKAEVHT